MASKKRISSDIDKNLATALDAKANELGIPRARLVETALETELGRFNVHKENKRLTERVKTSEQETAELRQQLTAAERQVTELTKQRDEFERLLHNETDTCNKYDEQVKSLKKERAEAVENLKQIASYLGVPDTVKHCKQRIDELQESIENREKERDTFKAKFEEAEANCRISSEKVVYLVNRNWWERLWNILPWVKYEIPLPTDETTIE